MRSETSFVYMTKTYAALYVLAALEKSFTAKNDMNLKVAKS